MTRTGSGLPLCAGFLLKRNPFASKGALRKREVHWQPKAIQPQLSPQDSSTVFCCMCKPCLSTCHTMYSTAKVPARHAAASHAKPDPGLPQLPLMHISAGAALFTGQRVYMKPSRKAYGLHTHWIPSVTATGQNLPRTYATAARTEEAQLDSSRAPRQLRHAGSPAAPFPTPATPPSLAACETLTPCPKEAAAQGFSWERSRSWPWDSHPPLPTATAASGAVWLRGESSGSRHPTLSGPPQTPTLGCTPSLPSASPEESDSRPQPLLEDGHEEGRGTGLCAPQCQPRRSAPPLSS